MYLFVLCCIHCSVSHGKEILNLNEPFTWYYILTIYIYQRLYLTYITINHSYLLLYDYMQCMLKNILFI